MKKNAMLKIAAILLVAVLLTTCAISSTFAKYVAPTKTVKSNVGYVADWGIEIGATATNPNNVTLFKSEYPDGGANVKADTDKTAVLAPGTSGSSSEFAITLTGKPEVAYQLDAYVDLELNGWTVAGDAYYCPLKITVTGIDNPFYGNDYSTEAEFETAVENAIANLVLNSAADPTKTAWEETGIKWSAKYAPNVAVNAKASNIAISWEWAFDDAVDAEADIDDTNDTFLGTKAADGNAPTIQIKFGIGAEQIQN